MRLDLHRSLCCFLGQHGSRAEHNKYGIGSIQGPIMVQASVDGFAERENKLYTATSIAQVNGCIACIGSWLIVIYIIFLMSDKQAAVIYRRVTRSANGFAIMKKQHLSSFLAGQGTLVLCIFMCFFAKLSNKLLWLFCLFLSFFFR